MRFLYASISNWYNLLDLVSFKILDLIYYICPHHHISPSTRMENEVISKNNRGERVNLILIMLVKNKFYIQHRLYRYILCQPFIYGYLHQDTQHEWYYIGATANRSHDLQTILLKLLYIQILFVHIISVFLPCTRIFLWCIIYGYHNPSKKIYLGV